MSIQERAMLVKLSISQWNPVVGDKKKSEELAKANNTTSEWMGADKRLVARASTDPIYSAFGKVRIFHYSLTLPWDDSGWRILPVATNVYNTYETGIQERTDEAMELVYELGRNFDMLKDDARDHLGDAYCEGDYPEDVVARYKVRKSVRPIPEGKYLKVAVAEDELARLRENVTANVNAQIRTSVLTLWERLRDVVATLADRMAKEKPRIYDSVITNIDDLVKILPQLNITADPDLDEIAEQVKKDLTVYRPDALRQSAATRGQVVVKARNTLKKIDAMIERGRKIDLDLE